MKTTFDLTPHSTVRVWIKYHDGETENEMFNYILDSSIGQFFQFVCCWGGYDKHEKGLISWELPLSLVPFLLQKFEGKTDFDLEYLRRYWNAKNK